MSNFLNKLPFSHHAWFMYLKLLFRHYIDDDCSQKAASLTYTTLLSIVPIITVLLVIFSSVLEEHASVEAVTDDGQRLRALSSPDPYRI